LPAPNPDDIWELLEMLHDGDIKPPYIIRREKKHPDFDYGAIYRIPRPVINIDMVYSAL
jgi:hypothetical protein